MTHKTIPLTRGFVTLVDEADYEWLSKWKWCYSATGTGYAARAVKIPKTRKNIHISMHRLIMNAPKGMQVDHINGNTLDNRRCNLRLCTNQQNCMNQYGKNKFRKYSSEYKGVCWNKRNNRWESNIFVDGKLLHLGTFKSEISAARTYNDAATKYFKEFARLNVIHD